MYFVFLNLLVLFLVNYNNFVLKCNLMEDHGKDSTLSRERFNTDQQYMNNTSL